MGPTQKNEKENSVKGKSICTARKSHKETDKPQNEKKKKNLSNEDTHKKLISEACKQLMQSKSENTNQTT